MLGVIRFQEDQHKQAIELIAGALKLNPPRRKPGSIWPCAGGCPYRADRAVIVDSNLFHKTDEIAFARDYENRRINIAMLYGRRRHG